MWSVGMVMAYLPFRRLCWLESARSSLPNCRVPRQFGEYWRRPHAARIADPIHHDAWPPESLSLASRIAESRLYPLNNQAALQFGDGAQNGKYHLAGRGAGLNDFLQRTEIHAQPR